MFAGAPAAGGRVVIKPAPYYTHSLRAAAGPPRAARAPLLESPYYLGKGSFNPCTNLLCSTSKLWWRAVLFVWYDLSASTDPSPVCVWSSSPAPACERSAEWHAVAHVYVMHRARSYIHSLTCASRTSVLLCCRWRMLIYLSIANVLLAARLRSTT